MRSLIRLILVLSCAAATATAVFCLAACSGEEDGKAEKPGGDDGGAQTALKHDADTYKMTGSLSPDGSEYMWHNFVDGKCTMCDETTIFEEQPVGDNEELIGYESAMPGTIETFTYGTRAYVSEALFADELNGKELPITKRAHVYLPAGYNDSANAETRYNVLILVHGNGLTEDYWLAQGGEGSQYTPESNAYTKGYGTENILDYLMDNGLAEKTIVVTPTFYSNYYVSESDIPTLPYPEYAVHKDDWRTTKYFGLELINDLLPYIALNYRTYAEVDENSTAEQTDAALKAARSHTGYAGLSMGSVTSFTSIWSYCLEYFGYIGSLSAGANSPEGDDFVPEIVEAKNTTYKDCEILYWYASSGTSEHPVSKFDTTFIPFIEQIDGLQHGSDVAAGDNCEFMTIQGTAHNYATWITDLYNFMQVFYKS